MPRHAKRTLTRGDALIRHARLVLASLALLAALAAEAQPSAASAGEAQALRPDAPRRELLNSERIEQRFGSYGIDVLESDGRYRVSKLYSVHNGLEICRTFAVVLYPEQVDARFAGEHEEILAGGSIGAVFARNGWTVAKTHLHFGELPATQKVAALMRIGAGEPLAVHVYLLTVSKSGTSFDYATIAEVHHSDYLSLADLPRIYGPPAAAGATAANPLLRDVLAQTDARMR